MPYSSEKILIKRLKNKDLKAFEFIFKKYNRNLVLYANRFIHDMNFAEDIVQDIFYKLWESNFNLEAKPSILAYLMQSVRNQCLNHIKHKRIREKHKSSLRLKLLKYELDYFNNQENITKSLYLGEIEKTIEATINSLPPRCKKIFHVVEKGFF